MNILKKDAFDTFVSFRAEQAKNRCFSASLKNKKTGKTWQDGRSMIEILGVLAIVGVLTVTGIYFYSRAMEKQQINALRDQVTSIVANMKSLKESSGSLQNINTDIAIKLGLFDSSNISTDAVAEGESSVKNTYKGNIWVESNNGGDVKSISLILDNIPRAAVMDIINSLEANNDPDLLGIDIVKKEEQ